MLEQLPAWNAALNTISTVLLIGGYRAIRAKQVARHRMFMISAFIVSMLFLTGYLLHKWHLATTTGAVNTVFAGPQPWRTIYLVILATHVVLAATIPVLAPLTIYRGWTMKVERHRKIARITLPIWLYVSVTGVIVYLMLYQFFPRVS